MNLSENVVNKLAYNMFIDVHSDNSTDIDTLMRKINLAINNELNTRQKQCIILYYYNSYQQKQIASILGITPACVCYHIKRAKIILYTMLKYHFL